MTVGGVSVPGWPWAWLILALALYGLGDLCYWATGVLGRLTGRVRDWWRDRVTPLLEGDRPEGVLCAGCAGFDHCDGVEGGCGCECGWPEDWADLPPERSWEQMTNPQFPVEPFWKPIAVLPFDSGTRERRPPAYEAEHRAHYVAMGFDYPSGLMARVREIVR